MVCSVEDCQDRAVYATAQLCKVHYDRRREHGDENVRPKFTRGWSIEAKLAHYREIPDDPDACWGWSGTVNTSGYALVHVGGRSGRQKYAHRLAYELEIEPIPEGKDVDHTCHNEDLSCPGGFDCLHRQCTNPRHLKAATRFENMRGARRRERWAAQGVVAFNARKTHCPRNHEYTDENTYSYVNRSGGISRQCKRCTRIRAEERKLRNAGGNP